MEVPSPAAPDEYNRHMNGVDLSDQLMEPYSIVRKTKHWWLKLAFQLIGCAIVNSYTMA